MTASDHLCMHLQGYVACISLHQDLGLVCVHFRVHVSPQGSLPGFVAWPCSRQSCLAMQQVVIPVSCSHPPIGYETVSRGIRQQLSSELWFIDSHSMTYAADHLCFILGLFLTNLCWGCFSAF